MHVLSIFSQKENMAIRRTEHLRWQKLRHNSSAHAEIVSVPGRMNKERVCVIKLVYLWEQMM